MCFASCTATSRGEAVVNLGTILTALPRRITRVPTYRHGAFGRQQHAHVFHHGDGPGFRP